MKILLKDLIIPAGTEFEEIKNYTEVSYGIGNYEALLGAGIDGVVTIIIPNDAMDERENGFAVIPKYSLNIDDNHTHAVQPDPSLVEDNICPNCNGQGSPDTCSNCGGTGKVQPKLSLVEALEDWTGKKVLYIVADEKCDNPKEHYEEFTVIKEVGKTIELRNNNFPHVVAWKTDVWIKTQALIHRKEEKSERFKMPTDKQLCDVMVLFNDGELDAQKLADMLAPCEFVVNRLYENGDVSVPSSIEDTTSDPQESEKGDENE